MVQHHDAVDHAHQHAHDVLDPDDGDAELVADLAQHVGRLVHLRLVEAAQALVGQQQLGLGGQRLGEFEHLAVRQGQRHGGLVGPLRQPDPVQDVDRLPPRRLPRRDLR